MSLFLGSTLLIGLAFHLFGLDPNLFFLLHQTLAEISTQPKTDVLTLAQFFDAHLLYHFFLALFVWLLSAKAAFLVSNAILWGTFIVSLHAIHKKTPIASAQPLFVLFLLVALPVIVLSPWVFDGPVLLSLSLFLWGYLCLLNKYHPIYFYGLSILLSLTSPLALLLTLLIVIFGLDDKRSAKWILVRALSSIAGVGTFLLLHPEPIAVLNHYSSILLAGYTSGVSTKIQMQSFAHWMVPLFLLSLAIGIALLASQKKIRHFYMLALGSIVLLILSLQCPPLVPFFVLFCLLLFLAVIGDTLPTSTLKGQFTPLFLISPLLVVLFFLPARPNSTAEMGNNIGTQYSKFYQWYQKSIHHDSNFLATSEQSQHALFILDWKMKSALKPKYYFNAFHHTQIRNQLNQLTGNDPNIDNSLDYLTETLKTNLLLVQKTEETFAKLYGDPDHFGILYEDNFVALFKINPVLSSERPIVHPSINYAIHRLIQAYQMEKDTPYILRIEKELRQYVKQYSVGTLHTSHIYISTFNQNSNYPIETIFEQKGGDLATSLVNATRRLRSVPSLLDAKIVRFLLVFSPKQLLSVDDLPPSQLNVASIQISTTSSPRKSHFHTNVLNPKRFETGDEYLAWLKEKIGLGFGQSYKLLQYQNLSLYFSSDGSNSEVFGNITLPQKTFDRNDLKKSFTSSLKYLLRQVTENGKIRLSYDTIIDQSSAPIATIPSVALSVASLCDSIQFVDARPLRDQTKRTCTQQFQKLTKFYNQESISLDNLIRIASATRSYRSAFPKNQPAQIILKQAMQKIYRMHSNTQEKINNNSLPMRSIEQRIAYHQFSFADNYNTGIWRGLLDSEFVPKLDVLGTEELLSLMEINLARLIAERAPKSLSFFDRVWSKLQSRSYHSKKELDGCLLPIQHKFSTTRFLNQDSGLVLGALRPLFSKKLQGLIQPPMQRTLEGWLQCSLRQQITRHSRFGYRNPTQAVGGFPNSPNEGKIYFETHARIHRALISFL